MYKKLRVAVVIPAYNEEKLIAKTVTTLPDSIDYIIVVNDASTDNTLQVLKHLANEDDRLHVLDNERNKGVGGSLIRGFKFALSDTDVEAIGIAAGDAQCDPAYIEPMLDELIKHDLDYIKANRFFHRDALKAMPAYRQIGNIFISLLTKFSTGYYSISDTQNSYGFFTRSILEQVNFDFVKERYDYENTMLIALSIAGAKLKDHPVPAIYGDEVSTIKFLPTALRALRAVWVGFWQRIYYKYVLYSFHPIALFLFSGIFLGTLGTIYGLFIGYRKVFEHLSPSIGTVMLISLPLFLGFQLVLTAIMMDMGNEGRS
ncbi:MAG TPA: glycosyltransferase family 2 protein [Verrucomicrobiae bacterium]|nr:glycosyltransferase family 2 protein [Verrucomicrobiae bacterium]